jgi:hypothetical protein
MCRFIARTSILCQLASSYTGIPALRPSSHRSCGRNVRTIANVGMQEPHIPNNNDNKNRIRLLKEAARYRRVEELLRIHATASGQEHSDDNIACSSPMWTENLEKELRGLQSRGDPYDATLFTDDHAAFKRGHNDLFVHLALNGGERGGAAQNRDRVETTTTLRRPVFYLDGKDGATTRALLEASFDRSTEMFMANEWSETVAALRAPPFDHVNCHFGSAHDCLRNHFRDVPFVAAYLDGCGGSPHIIIQMISALLSVPRSSTLYIGFTLTAAEPTGRELIDRVQDVTKATLQIAREQGYSQMDHVMDDPGWFGIDPMLVRKHQETTTCWVVCRRSEAESAPC